MVRLVTLDAIVLLGCRVEPTGRLSGAAQRRVARCAWAMGEYGARIVVASGGRRWPTRGGGNIAEAAALRDELVERHGVDPNTILPEWFSLSTAENARYSVRILRAQRLERVGVVTCDWHLPRALDCFRWEGVHALGIAAPSPTVSSAFRVWRWARERGAEKLDRLATWGWSRSGGQSRS